MSLYSMHSKGNLINIEENIVCLGESRCCALYWVRARTLKDDRQVLWCGMACMLQLQWKISILCTYRETHEAYCGEMAYDRTIVGITQACINEVNCDGVEMQGEYV
jgi:hypothetical protein